MNRRKDRERYQTMRRADLDYRGFRGYAQEPAQVAVAAELELATCTACGSARNVEGDMAANQRDTYVCSRCLALRDEETQDGRPEPLQE